MTEPAALPQSALSAVLASVPAAVVVTRAGDGRVLYLNGPGEALVGVTLTEITERPLAGVDLWADINQRSEMVAQLEAEGHVDAFPARMACADGRVIDVLSSFRPIEVDGETCLIAVTYDISERTEAEDALRRSERRLRQIAETIDEGFVLASFRPFRVHYASPAYAAIMGTTLDEVYADEPGLFARIEAEDRPIVKATLQRLRAGQRSDQIEVRLLRDGDLRWVRFRWSVVEDDEPEGVVAAVVEDVTERRRADTELRRARARAEEASQAKSSFLSRISHELRTPLNVILGFGQLLEADDLGPTQREAVREVMGAGRHLLHLVDEVLEISRAESGSLAVADEVIDLAPVVRDVTEALGAIAARRGVRVTPDASCTSAVRGDPRMLADALTQIVENAIVHNVPGGTVEVTCEHRPGDRVRIAVADTGPGMTPEDLERVYTPFERTQGTGGTGLGLTLARRLVEAMGGELGARSVPGRGSRFWIDLDRATPAARRAAAEGDDVATRRRVLYIEDNESNAELAARALAALPDVDLVVANRGADGLEHLATSIFDLVLLDLHLPDLDGEEILRRVRDDPETADLPVVVISADASPEVIARLRASGADDYLTKPVSIPHLIRVVDREAGGGTGPTDHPSAVGPAPSASAPGPPGADADVLDARVLDDLSVLEDVEPGTLRDVIEVFASAGADRIAAMRAGDRAAIGGLAHALRGSGANLGAVVLAAACRDLETLLEGDADDDAVAAQVAVVGEAFATAVESLRRHVGGGGP